MRQVISRTKYNVAFGGDEGWMDFGGEGNSVTAGSPDTEAHQIPMPVAGTFRNLSILAQSTHLDTVVALEVNGVASALSVSILEADTYESNTTDSVDVVVGDLVQLIYTAASSQPNGRDMSFAIEFEGAEQFYGICKDDWSLANGASMAGGALGNGFWTTTNAGSGTLTNNYSLNAVAGTLTGIYLHSFTGAPAAGSITAYLKKNAITQDGTGGTVNTGATLASGGGDAATSTFSLPIVVGDRLELQVRRTGATETITVGAAATFTPTDPTQPFMLVGGSNLVPSTHMWNQSNQAASQAEATSTSGPVRIAITGLAIEHDSVGGQSTTVTLLDDAVATAATVTIANPTTFGLITGLSVPILADSAVVLDVDTTSTGNLYWGLAAVFGFGPDAPTSTNTPIRRVRRFPLPNDELKRLFISRMELYAQVGVGTISGQGIDPVVMIRVSTNGGATWGHLRNMRVGELGAYFTRVYATRWGSGRDWIVELSTTDPNFVAWIDFFADISQGTS